MIVAAASMPSCRTLRLVRQFHPLPAGVDREHVGPLAHRVDERGHGLGADRHLAAIADGDAPGAVHDRIEDQPGLVLEPLGLGQFEAGADAVAACLHVVGSFAVLLGADLHLQRIGGA